jgi:hypothetical protein
MIADAVCVTCQKTAHVQLITRGDSTGELSTTAAGRVVSEPADRRRDGY